MTTETDVLERLKAIIEERAVLHGNFTLASGLKSSFYFDLRLATLWPESAYLIGKRIFEMIDGQVDAIGGLTIGADPIATAVAVVSHLEGRPIPAFIVRSETKGHGTQKQIEGPIPKNARVAIVDDVLTTGGSVLKAAEAVEAEGHEVVKMVVLLDRQQGGKENVGVKGYYIYALLKADAKGDISID